MPKYVITYHAMERLLERHPEHFDGLDPEHAYNHAMRLFMQSAPCRRANNNTLFMVKAAELSPGKDVYVTEVGDVAFIVTKRTPDFHVITTVFRNSESTWGLPPEKPQSKNERQPPKYNPRRRKRRW
jgi:hypothetical protein